MAQQGASKLGGGEAKSKLQQPPWFPLSSRTSLQADNGYQPCIDKAQDQFPLTPTDSQPSPPSLASSTAGFPLSDGQAVLTPASSRALLLALYSSFFRPDGKADLCVMLAPSRLFRLLDTFNSLRFLFLRSTSPTLDCSLLRHRSLSSFFLDKSLRLPTSLVSGLPH
jgi:hypothetical protein